MNTLRNQILAIFLFVMMIVLLIVSIMVYRQVGAMMKNNAELQIQQTAIEANGRMETLYKQVDTLSNQLVTNGTVQQLLLGLVNGKRIDFANRQSLVSVIRNFLAYSDGISSFELYSTEGKRIYPFDDKKLSSLIEQRWIRIADYEQGRLVWIGKDPNNKNYSYAIRRVSLMDRWYSNGGYLVVRISNSYFQVKENSEDGEKGYMALLDRDLAPITSDYGMDIQNILLDGRKTVSINQKEYMVVKESSQLTGWTLVILKPMSFLMEGVSVVRTAILFSGAIGYIIFLISSIFIATMITRPIKKLTNTMKNAKMDELKPNPESSSSLEIIELNRTYNQMVENTNHLIQEVYEKELLRSRTELKALQAQIDPHFLYNTLNALYWSLEEKGEEELGGLVIAMSELFRYTIGTASDGWVTIRDELNHIERYLLLMKMRLGDRLLWDISAPIEYLDVKIPKLTIQPLVENAILHGIENKRKQGSVSISIEKASCSSNLIISVQDNGMGIDSETLYDLNKAIENDTLSSLKGMGMALTNVNKRIQLYFDGFNLQGLHLYSEQGKGTKVIFEIPGEGAGYDGYKDNSNRR
ncbi:sensor histidine kinase [Neobacillus sp. PS3-40]|uniref:sensor histidine kinase n=1 Tax=Neobacillus sp. PS3-40 TaxID=3070679 RepID=UPI0027E1CFD1|nr:sensor histidine kinase [Neobacillus sp. PS3-40]WML42840.1 sensor histidine kinase [Neobacillus sp. PS3-40]